MLVKFKKLHPLATSPVQAGRGDVGFDLVATSVGRRGNLVTCGTSICVEIPEGYFGIIAPRSSITKYDLMLHNSIGIIDSSYRGELLLKFSILPNAVDPKYYDVGDKIGQLVILPYPKVELMEVDELSNTARGSKGFGSTDKTSTEKLLDYMREIRDNPASFELHRNMLGGYDDDKN